MEYGTLLNNKDISNYLSHYNQDQWGDVIENVLEYGIHEIKNQKQKEKEYHHQRNKQESRNNAHNLQRTISERQEQEQSKESYNKNNSTANQYNYRQCKNEGMFYKSLEKISKTSQYRGNRAEKRIDGKLDKLSDTLDYIPNKIKNERAPFDYY